MYHLDIGETPDTQNAFFEYPGLTTAYSFREAGPLEHCLASARRLSGVQNMAATHINATNSSTGICAARIRARSVPGAISRCCGTDKLAACPALMRMTWLPRWRSMTHPAFWKTRTAAAPEMEGKAAIYAGTSTSRTSIVNGMP